MYIIDKIFGDHSGREVKKIQFIVGKVGSYEEAYKRLSPAELEAKTLEFKDRVASGETLDEILPEAFALVREASTRTLGQRHYDVQLIGGIFMHQGKIAEMRTGEGKTLVATLPTYLNALSGKGVHVVTVNDYLARRDTVWMGQIYDLLGLSVAVINHQSSYLYDPKHRDVDEERDKLGSFRVVYEFLKPCDRKTAYLADITYGTNHEFGFDYLRDNIAYSVSDMVQRVERNGDKISTGHNFAIIDEVDSILIDEARTPLIISSNTDESEDLYQKFAKIADNLRLEEDYKVDEKLRATTLTEEGINKAEKILGVGNIYTEGGIKYVHHLETAVRAKALYHKDKEYVVNNDGVIIVDESTGRLQPGRRWSEGLHQAIEAKEGVKVEKESRTVASITIQNYFRMYTKLSGMTGTAITSSEEFFRVYGLDTIAIPTHRSIKRVDSEDLIFQNESGKFKAIAAKIKELNEKGQPVLVGTVSIEKNELLSRYLSKEGVKHDLLNAKNHEREGEIIAGAGRKGSVVIATNMAGRGVDIKLGGIFASDTEYEEVKSLGGLFVLGTERHDARRIDNQLRGRSGRQGDPGETQFYVSLEDSLMRIFASDTVKNMMGRFGIPEDEPIQNRLITKSIEAAQTKIEGFNFDSRKHLLEYDDVMNHQRKIIYERRRNILLGDVSYVNELLDRYMGEFGGDEVSRLRGMLGEKKVKMGEENFYNALRMLAVQTIDMLWVDHLEIMDYMRSSVRLRAYGQRDPLVEYKREGLRMFKELEDSLGGTILRLVPTVGENLSRDNRVVLSEVHESAKLIGDAPKGQLEHPDSAEKPVAGRNDPCPCGSGKKYKKCHGG
ncbi:MAG: preprotein translocase subunit SecA [Candidatus Vogelbacteria bacterium]|nr:preprotein translocase subunit SecA [Candidatus Vogelbacteria bacterium]